jgi:hypothetical protein
MYLIYRFLFLLISGFLAEILLPVLFMFFLIMIKSVTTKYDSPNVAYHCGEAYPWAYNNQWTNDMSTVMPYMCSTIPDTCEVKNYYRGRKNFGMGFDIYTENGKHAFFSYLLLYVYAGFSLQDILIVQLIKAIHFIPTCLLRIVL